MPSKKTIARLEAQILRRAAHCLQFEVSDPRMGFVTLTGVELSKDMAYATIRYSVLGDDAECSKTNAMLEQARGFVQRQVASILRTRTTPTLRWEYDPSIAAASQMEQLIQDVQTRDEQIRLSNDGPGSVTDEAEAAD
ncbi:MAG TPA: 30S ribosome-binding factor RbfA [Planctomycetes bacterium]|nr:30S ribosome-binding factor RbfA [Planctomycetota bacterium]HIK61950.1 30S ribosome-binding factor RbfA [Planctomycetota bacterium]